MKDINLISTNELISELMSRSDGLVLAYMNTKSGNEEIIYTKWSDKAPYLELIGMADMLKYQLLDEYHNPKEREQAND